MSSLKVIYEVSFQGNLLGIFKSGDKSKHLKGETFSDNEESEDDEETRGWSEINLSTGKSKGDENGSVFKGDSSSASAARFSHSLSILSVSHVTCSVSHRCGSRSRAGGRTSPRMGLAGSSVMRKQQKTKKLQKGVFYPYQKTIRVDENR